MDFSLNQEQEMFRSYVRKYLDDVGQTKVAREFTEGNTSSFQKLYAGLAELGCTSVNVSEAHGGMGLGQLDLVPILEEMGRALLPGLFLETNALVVPLLEQFGTAQQKAKYLSAIASGDHTFTVAWLEPGGNYKPSNVQVHGSLEGDVLTLNGVKALVPDVELANSLLVVVRTAEGQDKQGISLVIVDCDAASLQVQGQKNMDETRLLAEVTFHNVQVSSQQIVGTVHQGWDALQEALLSFNAALCSSIVGSVEKIVETAVEYATIREQFNQPIGRFQAIKHRLVDMKMDLETARSLAYYANWAIESDAEDKVEAVSSARLFATEAFIKVASQSIQIHGGIGFTEEIDCHLYVKRARFYENYLGTTQQYYEQTAVALGW